MFATVFTILLLHATDCTWYPITPLTHSAPCLQYYTHNSDPRCIFDQQLKAQDTVIMNLYKRVFPKWTYQEYDVQPGCIALPTAAQDGPAAMRM